MQKTNNYNITASGWRRGLFAGKKEKGYVCSQ